MYLPEGEEFEMECLLKGESPKTHEKKRRTVVYDREYIYQYIRNTVMKPLKFSDAESFCGFKA
jgi:hypothetical protein